LGWFFVDWRAFGREPGSVWIVSDAGAAFGGTGNTADWKLIANERDALGDIPLILAGGLTPTNVAAAIEAVRPDAVDVASGVEREPGKKDHDLIKRFIAAAQEAFSHI
jgi:phosphoribosylanthranilate isomerase